MITKNFKQMLAMIFLSNGGDSSPGIDMPVVTTANETMYLSPCFSRFPGSAGSTMSTVRITSGKGNAGIYLGSGTNPPTENDHFIRQPITSGLTASYPVKTFGLDSNGNPYLQHMFMLTNTTSSDIVVSEIGYVQVLNDSSAVGGSCTYDAFLLDRTVLDVPVTVPANDSAVVKYTLKTILPS